MGEREPARALREGDPGRGVQPLAEQLALVLADATADQGHLPGAAPDPRFVHLVRRVLAGLVL